MKQRYPDLWTESYKFVGFMMNANVFPPNWVNPDANNTLVLFFSWPTSRAAEKKTYATVFSLFVCFSVC